MTVTEKNASAAGEAHQGPGRRARIGIPVLLLVLVACVAYWFWQNYHPLSGELSVSGRIEGYETNVGAKIGGRVDFIAVREGDLVKVAQPIVKISDDDVQAQLRGARARWSRAREQAELSTYQIAVVNKQIDEAMLRVTQTRLESRAQIDQSEAGVAQARARLSQADAELSQARAELKLAEVRRERFDWLVQRGAVTTDEDDQARTTCDTAQALVKSRECALDAARKQLAVSQAALEQARSTRLNPPIRRAQLGSFNKQMVQALYQQKSAQADIASAKAQEDEIAANIAYLNIASPIDGVVTARAVEPGAVVVPGQTLLSLINLDTVYMRAYVPEGRIGDVAVGQKARVRLDSAPGKPLEGTVIEVDPEGSFTPENIYFKDDRVKQVFGIKIAITHPAGLAKPGMPADAEIVLSGGRR